MTNAKTVIDLMHESPLVSLKGRGTGDRRAARLWAKLELAQPGQMKDRVARHLVEAAVHQRTLRPGRIIAESSSGTMAEGLARVGALLGFRVIIVTDPTMGGSLQAKLQAFGCDVQMVNKSHEKGGSQRSRLERLARVLAEHPGGFWPHQYDNPDIPQAYAEEVGREITNAIGKVDAFVAAVGSGSSLCGTASALREVNPEIRIIAVDAVGSVLFHQPAHERRQTGHGNSLIPGNLDYEIIDEAHWLNDGEVFNGCRELARTEGIFAGGSSGASYIVASWVARHLPEDANVVTLFPDRGDRYARTIYSDEYMIAEGLHDITAGAEPLTIRYGVDVATRWSRAALPHDTSVAYHAPAPAVFTTRAVSEELGLPLPARPVPC